MDPLSALALSGNVLQFIDGASKLISEARRVCQSASGITAGNRDAVAVYEDFQTVAAGLLASQTAADDSAIVSLARKCHELSDELVQSLKRLQAKTPGSRRESLRIAWRALRDKGELESLEKRLERYRQELVTRIIFIISEGQSSTYRFLEAWKRQSENSGTKTGEDLQRLRMELLDLSQKVQQHSLDPVTGNALQDSHDAMVEKITNLITGIITTRGKAEKEQRILNQLAFPGIRRRENAIEPARAGSYRWLLYPPSAPCSDEMPASGPTPPIITQKSGQQESSENSDSDDLAGKRIKALWNLKRAVEKSQSLKRHGEPSQLHAQTRERFLTWLESGSGMFYISGKPGSGKSTMMKFVAQEKRTVDVLMSWAADKKLAFASFFFWTSGLPLQRSIEGLYRGLLWQTLRNCPELIPGVFPRMWDDDVGSLPDTEFLLSELEEAFLSLIGTSSTLPNHRICFFIDGLDEFEGDHSRLAKLLKEWAASGPDVKVCVSSRPYSAFEHSFVTQPELCIRLHEYTYQDMIRVAQDELGSTEGHATLVSDPDYGLLIKSAVKKANGVFLWFHLALRHLVRGMGSRFSVRQLAELLHGIPGDVSDIFQKMLDKVLARPDRFRVALTLLCLSNTELSKGVGRYVMSFAIMDDALDGTIGPDDLLENSLGNYSPDRIKKHLSDVEARLRGRCEDFIQIRGHPDNDFPSPLQRYVEFVHRDLRDFLVQDHIARKLYKATKWSPPKLSSKLVGLNRYLGIVLLKMVPSIARRRSIVDSLVDDFYYAESVSAPEFELLVHLILANNEETRATEGILQRYCSVLALRDDMPGQRIVHRVYYGRDKRQDSIHLGLSLLSAAAFYRLDEYVLGMVTRHPPLLQFHFNGSLLLSATLGGAAALSTFVHRQTQKPGKFRGRAGGKFAVDSLSRMDFITTQSGVGGLLLSKTPRDFFQTSASIPTLDVSEVEEAEPAQRPLRRGGPDPLMLARSLLQKGASPNARMEYFELPHWHGSCWTPWTATLLCLAGVIRKGELLDGTLLDVVELYLSHGADPTVCFVGRYLPEHKLEPLTVWRLSPGVYFTAQPKDIVGDLLGDRQDSWYYLTLSQLLELVGDHHPKKKTVADLLYSKSPWAVSKWASAAAARLGGSRGGRTGTEPATNISKLELAELGDSYFFVSMIVSEHELVSVRVPDDARSRLLPAQQIPI